MVVSLGGKKALRPRVPDAVTSAMITGVIVRMGSRRKKKRLTAVTTFGVLESQTLHHIGRQDVFLSSPENAKASVEIDYASVVMMSDFKL